MENMTLEQLISTFGPEVGQQMFDQMNASSGGNRIPFPLLKPVSTHGTDLGNFGDFVFGVETEKAQDGTKTITNSGTNVGNSFEFIIVNVAYRYKKWDAVKERNYQSNMFSNLEGIKTAVDAYTGKPLPISKEDKKDAGWVLVRINAGIVRKNSKAPWMPVVWETKGAMYFSLGNVINSQPQNGLLSGILKVTTKLAAKGSTQYPVIDETKSSFEALPKDFWTNKDTTDLLGNITKDMTAYVSSNQFSGQTPATQGQSEGAGTPSAPETDDHTNW